MRKAVLISIKPEWCDFIKNGVKTLEVRKSCPKLHVPFKVYIYCTIHGGSFLVGGKNPLSGNGKVIGEFICDGIFVDETYGHNKTFYDMACMSEIDIAWYCCQSPMYGWHISDLKIYDRPKELREFSPANCGKKKCFACECFDVEKPSCTLKRPPQSWCYVEKREDNG